MNTSPTIQISRVSNQFDGTRSKSMSQRRKKQKDPAKINKNLNNERD